MKITKKVNKSISGFRGKDLVSIPEESVWLANFTSKPTKTTYSVSVREYFHFHRMQTQEDLRNSTQSHVISWRDAMIEAEMAASTINNRLSALSSLFNHLCEKQVMAINPVNGIKRPKVDQRQVKSPVLTKEQARAILDAPGLDDFKSIRQSTILAIYFYSGCRRSEVGSLRLKDLRIDNGYDVIVFKTKGGKENMVPMHPELKRVLDLYLAIADHFEDGDSPLFVSISNNRGDKLAPLSPKSFNAIFNQNVAKAELPDFITPHSARTTFATQALANNCDIKDVQRALAHSNINTTMMYDQRTREHKDAASLTVKF
jgi:integrase/recombinase XerD